MRKRSWSVVAAFVLFLACGALRADDWPQFRGPNRDGRSAETGLLKQWPEGGPRLLWTAAGLGKGYSHAVVVGGRVYTTGLAGKEGVLRCLDANGTLRWEKSYGPEWSGDKPGSRSIPTIHGGLVYVTSGMGWVSCFDANTGDKKWSEDVLQRYEGAPAMWGWAESLLVDGSRLFITPCGKKGTMVAVDRFTGAAVWASAALGERTAYCSPLMIEAGAARQIVTLTNVSVLAVDPNGGQVLWKHPYKNFRGNHCVTPLYKDGFLYVTSGYGEGAVGLQLDASGRSVKQLWKEKKEDTVHGGVVLVDGLVYGSSHQNSPGWVCADFLTGKVAWKDKCVGKGGSVVYADGMLYCYSEEGAVGLARPSGKACEVVSRFPVTQGAGEHWAHLAISNGRLYVRHGDALMCYDIRARE